MKNTYLGWTLLACLATSSGAAAEDSLQKTFELSGYATIGTMQIDKSDARYRGSFLPAGGASDYPFLGTDSVLALQARGALLDDFSYMIQGVARRWGVDDYTPKVSWATLNYEIQPGLLLRVGRTNPAFFMHSDTLFVNYVREWIRPPVEVYSLSPFVNMTGVDLGYRTTLGPYLIEGQAYTGYSQFNTPYTTLKLRDLFGARLLVSADSLSVQVSYANAHLTTNTRYGMNDRLYSALDRAGFSHIKNEIEGDDSRSRYASIGFRYDSDVANLSGEYAKRTVSKYFPSAHAWYLSVSKRFGDFTPYYYYAHQHSDREPISSKTDIPSIDRALRQVGILKNVSQRTHAFGVRYEIAKNAAFKAEITRSRPDRDSWGIFAPENLTLDKPSDGKSINGLGFSLDFVF